MSSQNTNDYAATLMTASAAPTTPSPGVASNGGSSTAPAPAVATTRGAPQLRSSASLTGTNANAPPIGTRASERQAQHANSVFSSAEVSPLVGVPTSVSNNNEGITPTDLVVAAPAPASAASSTTAPPPQTPPNDTVASPPAPADQNSPPQNKVEGADSTVPMPQQQTRPSAAPTATASNGDTVKVNVGAPSFAPPQASAEAPPAAPAVAKAPHHHHHHHHYQPSAAAHHYHHHPHKQQQHHHHHHHHHHAGYAPFPYGQPATPYMAAPPAAPYAYAAQPGHHHHHQPHHHHHHHHVPPAYGQPASGGGAPTTAQPQQAASGGQNAPVPATKPVTLEAQKAKEKVFLASLTDTELRNLLIVMYEHFPVTSVGQWIEAEANKAKKSSEPMDVKAMLGNDF